jgi:hypothetical protein
MMKRIDLWLGKNLFQPPIILACQLTGMTQYAVHRYLWWAIIMFCVWSLSEGDHWLWKAVTIFMGVCHTISAGLSPDRPIEGSKYWFRKLLIVLLALELAASAALLQFPSMMLVAMMFAEYALTIKTIPPRKTKEAVGNGRRVEA